MANTKLPKITQPEATNAVKRLRLFSLLRKACRKPIIWISAPAGSGKTTLAASFFDHCRRSVLWYRLDERDVDSATFFSCMRLAARKYCSAKSDPLPFLPPEHAYDEIAFARGFFDILFETLLHSGIPPPVLVLDNYHLLPEKHLFHKVLAKALESVPRGMNVCILSRFPPPAQCIKLRANNRLALIGWDEIKFSLQESRELVRRSVLPTDTAQRKAKQAVVRASPMLDHEGDAFADFLCKAADGWAAGLVLLTELFKSGKVDVHCLQLNHPPEELLEYFAEEVYDSIDPELQAFLIETAVLPEMTVRTAEGISGNKHAGSILSELHRRNCFTEKRVLGDTYYQYHPLFRNFLLVKAHQRFSGPVLKEMCIHAANLLACAGQDDDAIELLLAADDGHAALEHIHRQAPNMVREGRLCNLETWLRRLPESVLTDQPWAFFWLGTCCLPVSPEKALRCFERAFHGFVSRDDTASALYVWSGAVDSILLERGNFSRLDFWIEWLDEQIDRGMSYPSRDVESRIIFSMVGVILFRHFGHPRAQDWLSKAEKLLAEDLDPENIVRASNLIIYHLVVGNHPKAGVLIKKMEQLIAPSSPAFLRIQWCLIRAKDALYTAGNGKEALRLVDQGLVLAESVGIRVFNPYLHALGAQSGLTFYDQSTASHHLDLMSLQAKGCSLWDLSTYHYLRGWLELDAGSVHTARDHLQTALDLVLDTGCPLCLAVRHVGMAHVFLEMNDNDEAQRHLVAAESLIPRGGGAFEFMYLLVETIVWLQSGNEKRGLPLLDKVFALGRRRGYVWTPFWRRSVMSLLCSKALERNIETVYALQLIRKRELQPQTQAQPQSRGQSLIMVQNWPYSLKIYTLGRFELERSGKRLTFPRKTPKKALELLQALICFGGKDVDIQILIDVLFPDADGDKAYQSFKYRLHTLRRLLGDASYTLLRNGRLSLDFNRVYVDSESFLGFCNEIQSLRQTMGLSLSRKNTPMDAEYVEQVMQLCGNALPLYKGDFLEHVNSGWAVAARQMLRRRYQDLVGVSGVCLEHCGRSWDAIQLYEQSIETDELHEPFYQRLMVCLGSTGRHADVVSVYQRCTQTLGARLGIDPSPETKAVYQSFIAG